MKYTALIFLVIIMFFSTGCSDYIQYEPSDTPFICNWTVPTVTPEPVYKRPENPVVTTTHLTYTKLPLDRIPDIFFSKEHSCSDNVLIYSETIDGERLYGYMDLNLNKLTKPISRTPGFFVNGLARIVDGDGEKVIDRNFEIVEADYRMPFEYKGQWVEVCRLSDGRYNLLGYDENNQEIFELDDYYFGMDFDEYRDADPKTSLVPCCMTTEKGELMWGYKHLNDAQDSDSNFIIEPIFTEAGKFREGLASVKKGGKWGYIDTAGQTVIDFRYDRATDFSGNMAGIAIYDPAGIESDSRQLLWGLINNKGEAVADTIFTTFYGVSDGFAQLYKHGYGHSFFDSEGNSIFKKPVNVKYGFNDGFTIERYNDGVRAINTTGISILKNKYSEIYYFNPGFLHVQLDNKTAVINFNEEFILIPEYRHIAAFDKGYAMASYKSGEAFIIDMAGNEYMRGMNLHNISRFNDDGYALAYSDYPYNALYLIHIDND